MPSTQWNDEEEFELQGLPPLTQIVYLRCFRRHMDYNSGLVGAVRKISYQMMIETCETIRERGSKYQNIKPTRNQLRAAIQQLLRRGLLQLVSKRMQQPIYRLPLATVNRFSPTATLKNGNSSGGESSGSNEEQPMNNQEEQPEEQPTKSAAKPLNVVSFENKNNQRNNQQQEGMNDIHQGSGIPNLTIPVQILLDEEKLKHAPTSGSEWGQFLMDKARYALHEVRTINVMTMFRLWCDSNFTLSEAVVAIEAAESKLGARPDTPAYYKNFAAQIIRDRNKKLPQGVHHVSKNKRLSAKELAEEQLLGGHRVYEHET